MKQLTEIQKNTGARNRLYKEIQNIEFSVSVKTSRHDRYTRAEIEKEIDTLETKYNRLLELQRQKLDLFYGNV